MAVALIMLLVALYAFQHGPISVGFVALVAMVYCLFFVRVR